MGCRWCCFYSTCTQLRRGFVAWLGKERRKKERRETERKREREKSEMQRAKEREKEREHARDRQMDRQAERETEKREMGRRPGRGCTAHSACCMGVMRRRGVGVNEVVHGDGSALVCDQGRACLRVTVCMGG